MNRNATFTRDSTDRSFSNFPTVYTEGKKESPDFSTLSREDQDGLFLGDKMNKNTSSSKAFYDLVKNDDTSPTSDEIFEFWGKNHKRVFTYKIQTKGGEETVKYTYDNLPDDKKALELKKWRANTKKKFRKGGISGYTTKAYEKVNDGISDNRLEQIGSDASEYFNAYTNPTLINNKNLNLQANMGIDSEVGWNANNTKFSKYGSPTVNLGGSFGLSGKYTKNNFTANAGVNYQTGSRPSYNAGLSYNFKKGGYKH